MPAVALVVRPDRPALAQLAVRVGRWWRVKGYEVVDISPPDGPPLGSDGMTAEFAISLGGDGTMLRAVDLASPFGIPVLGVNLGRMGYLTEVEPSGIEAAFERLVAGDYRIDERMTLEVVAREGSDAADERPAVRTERRLVALNEAIVEKTAPGHTIRVAVSIADRPFLTYEADGLLVATPTGSTAYNLSARGPIVSPKLRAMVLTPVSPHMLFDRSLVLEPEEWVTLHLLDGPAAALVVDGSDLVTMSPGSTVTISLCTRPALIITFGTRDFHSILRAKFGLTDR